jgi:hypothetical protein
LPPPEKRGRRGKKEERKGGRLSEELSSIRSQSRSCIEVGQPLVHGRVEPPSCLCRLHQEAGKERRESASEAATEAVLQTSTLPAPSLLPSVLHQDAIATLREEGREDRSIRRGIVLEPASQRQDAKAGGKPPALSFHVNRRDAVKFHAGLPP